MRSRILVVDDEPAIIALLERLLSESHDVHGAGSAEEGLLQLRLHSADALITDLRLPGMDGVALARRVRREHPAMPIIGISGNADLPELAELLRLGMVDFLVKPFSADEARLAVARALAMGGLGVRTAAVAALAPDPLATLAGEGALLTALRGDALRAAASPASLLIEGPSGSGKTMLARAVHAASARADEPLIELACAALPETLLEGELFGHAAGAFTGATRDRPGVFERARGGTLVLDEVIALTPHAQARLVHALSSRTVTRLGEDRPRPIEARVIATSQRALEPLTGAGGFRDDLFHALAVLRLRTPALCELPPGDRDRLTRMMLARTCARLGRPEPGIDASFVEAASRHPWPGNVRELENALERAVLLGDGGDLTEEDLADGVSVLAGRQAISLPPKGIDLAAVLSLVEEDHLRRALERTGGNREHAAALLGLTRTALVQKLRRLSGASEPAP